MKKTETSSRPKENKRPKSELQKAMAALDFLSYGLKKVKSSSPLNRAEK